VMMVLDRESCYRAVTYIDLKYSFHWQNSALGEEASESDSAKSRSFEWRRVSFYCGCGKREADMPIGQGIGRVRSSQTPINDRASISKFF
jgi:hypothetical protein